MISLKKNTQPSEGVDYHEDGSLDVVRVWRTIQGEGPFAGNPAVFVRLAGCNLQCPACDTDYTGRRIRMSVDDLLTAILKDLCKTVRPSPPLVVLTGGEPLRQDVGPLCCALHVAGVMVQVETNGALGPKIHYDHVIIVCSPKVPKIHERLADEVDYYKYVLQAGCVDPRDGLPTSILENGVRPARPRQDFEFHRVYVQPLDEGDQTLNEANAAAAVESSMRFGYRLGVQMHKYVGLD